MATPQRPNLGAGLIRTHRAITRGLNVSINRGQDFAASGFASPELRAGYGWAPMIPFLLV